MPPGAPQCTVGKAQGWGQRRGPGGRWPGSLSGCDSGLSAHRLLPKVPTGGPDLRGGQHAVCGHMSVPAPAATLPSPGQVIPARGSGTLGQELPLLVSESAARSLETRARAWPTTLAVRPHRPPPRGARRGPCGLGFPRGHQSLPAAGRGGDLGGEGKGLAGWGQGAEPDATRGPQDRRPGERAATRTSWGPVVIDWKGLPERV